MWLPAFEPVIDTFLANFEQGCEIGAAGAVYHRGTIAGQISDPELAQVPQFIPRLSEDLCPSLPPTMVQLVDFVLAV